MAFIQKDYDNSGDGLGVAPKMATYITTDTNATVTAAGYFDIISDFHDTGDLLYVLSSDATKIFSLTVDKAAGTVVLALQLLFVVVT